MTDEQKAELTRLARESLEAEDKSIAANRLLDESLEASNNADKRLAHAMASASIDRVVLNGVMYFRYDDTIEIYRKGTLTLP